MPNSCACRSAAAWADAADEGEADGADACTGAPADSWGAAVETTGAGAVSLAAATLAVASGTGFGAFEQAVKTTIETTEMAMRRGMWASLDQVPALVATEQDARVVASARA
jgi:hypothetical protein